MIFKINNNNYLIAIIKLYKFKNKINLYNYSYKN